MCCAPRSAGVSRSSTFRDGERVRKGQLLVQFDDQLPAAQLKQSLAEQSIAAANHKRNQELLAQKFVSQRSVEESAANLEVAQAKVALAQATLERLKVKAPFDGIAGIRMVNQGDYLKDGADIVNIEDIDAVLSISGCPSVSSPRSAKASAPRSIWTRCRDASSPP
jgi:membrane fusion protein (multidrug efflux system)